VSWSNGQSVKIARRFSAFFDMHASLFAKSVFRSTFYGNHRQFSFLLIYAHLPIHSFKLNRLLMKKDFSMLFYQRME